MKKENLESLKRVNELLSKASEEFAKKVDYSDNELNEVKVDKAYFKVRKAMHLVRQLIGEE
ncbi:MAG: hypothetical protein MJZ98_00480 [Paludibacteraceae bacterium]|nr:hypothetical protein [Paludibacteraceae bacterium]